MNKILLTTDEVIEVTTSIIRHPRRIQFHDIMAACRLIQDDDYDPFDIDGQDHKVLMRNPYTLRNGVTTDHFPDEADRRSFRGAFYSNDMGGWCAVVTTRRMARKWGNYDYARRNGASRQVAAELEALNIRQNVEYVRGLYADGAEAYGVVCQFYGEEESCWGFTPYEYADTDGRREIAGQVAHNLERDGYIIEGYPVEQSVTVHNYKIRDNLNSQNWK